MSKQSLSRLAAIALLLGLSLVLSGAGTSSEALTETIVQCPISDTASVEALGGGLGFLRCPATNENGCAVSDIACTGYQCCCIYAGSECPSGSTSSGPCWSIFDPPE